MHEKKPSKSTMRLNIGSASIIMLFAVLCLTVLAALSLLSANSQWRLATRSADAVTEYYVADLEASEIFARIEMGEDVEGVHIGQTPEGLIYSYEVPINDRQMLAVTLRESVLGLEIETWKAVESGSWSPDFGLNIWDGEPLEG